MTKIYVLLAAIVLINAKLAGQSFDFQNSVYYTAAGNTLTSSGTSLFGFNFSAADANHPLLNDGIYFPIVDYLGKNIWVKVRHAAADPNGTGVGVNVAATCGDPFRAGFGGWAGFLYQFDIYKDAALTGSRVNTLDGAYPASIQVESIETLSAGEWVSFELLNSESSNWVLNSINFTGNNPGSTPGFSANNIPWPSNPPGDFSTSFPEASKNIYVIDHGGPGYAEFRMSADNVSSFNYGYEYTQLCGGYQGMNMSFGLQSTTPLKLLSFTGSNQTGSNKLLWKTTSESNTSFFSIERSQHGQSFAAIGQVPANNTSGIHNYTFTDTKTGQANNYYRMRQVDKNGQATYTKVIMLSGNQFSAKVYPNPAKNALMISNIAGSGTITVTNTLGKTLIKQYINATTVSLNIAGLPAGIYFVSYKNDINSQTLKIIIQ